VRCFSVLKVLCVLGVVAFVGIGCKGKTAAVSTDVLAGESAVVTESEVLGAVESAVVFPSNGWACEQAAADGIGRWIQAWRSVYMAEFPATVPGERYYYMPDSEDVLFVRVETDALYVDDAREAGRVKIGELGELPSEIARRIGDAVPFVVFFELGEGVTAERFQQVLAVVEEISEVSSVRERVVLTYRAPSEMFEVVKLPEALQNEMQAIKVETKATLVQLKEEDRRYYVHPRAEAIEIDLFDACSELAQVIQDANDKPAEEFIADLETGFGPAWVSCGCKGDIESFLALRTNVFMTKDQYHLAQSVERAWMDSLLAELDSKRWNEMVYTLSH